MKILPVVIAASLAGNAALIALLVVSPRPDRPAETKLSPAELASTRAAATGAAAAKGESAGEVDPKLWAGFSSGDQAALVARLRAAGFPPSLVRAIVAAQVAESFSARGKELMAATRDVPFWKTNQPTDPKTLAALRDLTREQTKVMKELLGPTADNTLDDPMYAAYLRRQLGDLPGEKADQVARLRRDYDEMRSEIYSSVRGGSMAMLPEDRAKLLLLDKEQNADIAKVLTPQEFENYELRTSNTANLLRYTLDAFEPSEAEFRTIYQLRRTLDEQFPMLMNIQPTQEQITQRQEAEKLLNAKIKDTLGAERGADYERSIDGTFQQINRVVARLELPKEAVVQVWEVQKDIEQRANAVRANAELPGDARNQQLAALALEATTKIGSTLGPRGLEVYKQYGGSWIQNLQPRPAGSGTATIRSTRP